MINPKAKRLIITCIIVATLIICILLWQANGVIYFLLIAALLLSAYFALTYGKKADQEMADSSHLGDD